LNDGERTDPNGLSLSKDKQHKISEGKVVWIPASFGKGVLGPKIRKGKGGIKQKRGGKMGGWKPSE